LRITRNIGTAVLVEWDPIPGAILYQLRFRELPAGIWTYVTQSTQLSRKIYELVPGTMYELELRHRIGTIWQPWAAVYAPVPFETEVISFTATYDIGTKFMIEWTPVPDASSYVLQYRKVPSTTWITKGYYPTNSAGMVNMEEGTSYEYRICHVSVKFLSTGHRLEQFLQIT
jgi:hypothetical protein